MLFVALLLSLTAQAESWCAYPLHAHEWGVQVFSADGVPMPPVDMPSWFYRDSPNPGPEGTPVRDLPVDTGARTLPVVQFYAPVAWGNAVPVGVEVGFRQGRASLWYPQADLLRPATQANSGEAPTAQLAWEALILTPEPSTAPRQTDQAWVPALRGIDAMWLNRGGESERFLFYEADTTERPALRVERGESWSPSRPHYVLHNDTAHPVHDVFVLVEGGEASFHAPQIPAGRSAGFLLDQARVPDPQATLRASLVDHDQPAPATDYNWAGEDCVMGRDPAVPVTESTGHRLFDAEVDAILGVWAPRFFSGEDTVILYREDAGALSELMPLSIYTDMYHFVELRRLGLVVWEGLDLVAMTDGAP